MTTVSVPAGVCKMWLLLLFWFVCAVDVIFSTPGVTIVAVCAAAALVLVAANTCALLLLAVVMMGRRVTSSCTVRGSIVDFFLLLLPLAARVMTVLLPFLTMVLPVSPPASTVLRCVEDPNVCEDGGGGSITEADGVDGF